MHWIDVWADRTVGKTRFICGNDRIDRLVADQMVADDVARYAAERAEMNRLYAQGLEE